MGACGRQGFRQEHSDWIRPKFSLDPLGLRYSRQTGGSDSVLTIRRTARPDVQHCRPRRPLRSIAPEDGHHRRPATGFIGGELSPLRQANLPLRGELTPRARLVLTAHPLGARQDTHDSRPRVPTTAADVCADRRVPATETARGRPHRNGRRSVPVPHPRQGQRGRPE